MPGESSKGDNPIAHMVNLYLQNREALCTLGLSMSYWDCFQQCVEAWKINDWQARVERLINICLHYEAPSAEKKAFNTIRRVIGNEEGQSMIANLLQDRFFENVDARSRPPNSFAAVLVAALHGSYGKRKEAIRRARSKFDRDMKAVVQQQQGNADSEFCFSNFGSRDDDDGARRDCGSSGEITENMLHVATFLDFLTISPSYEQCYQQCLNAWKIPDVRDRVKQLFAVVMNYEASQEERNALNAMLPHCEGATKAEKMRYSQVCLTHLLEARLFKDDGVSSSSKPPPSFAPVFAALIGETLLERKRGIRDACSAFVEDMKLLARKQKANVDSVVPNWDDFVCPGARDNLIGKKSKTRDRPTKGVNTDDDGDGGDSHANSEANSSEPPGLDSTDDEGDGISLPAFQQRQQAAKNASAAPSGIKRGFFDSPTKPSRAEGQKGNKKNGMSRGGGGCGGGRQVKRTDEVSECDAARNVDDRYDDNGEDSCDDIPELVDPDESSSDGDEAHCTGTQPSGLKRGFFNAEGSSSSTAATFNTTSKAKARKEIPAKAAEAAQRQTVPGAEPGTQSEEGQAVEEAEVKPARSRNKRQQTAPQPRYEFERFESESIKEMQRKEAEQRRELRKKLGLETNPTPDSDPILGPCHLGKSCVRFSDDGEGGQVRESHAERVFVRCSQGCEFYYHQSCWRKAWITSPEEDAGSTDKILGRHFRWTKPQVQQGRYPCFNEDCKGAVVYAQGPKKHVYVDTTARIKHTHGKGEPSLFPNKGGGEAQGTRGEERGRRSKEGTDQGYREEEEEEYGEKYRHCIEDDEDGTTVKEGGTTKVGAGAAESPGRKVEERDTKEENQDDDHSMPLSKEGRRRAVAPSPQVAAFELPEDASLRPLLRDDDEDDDDLRVHRASKKDKNAPVPAVAEVLYDEDVQHGQGARSSHAGKRKKGGGGGGQKLHWAELFGENASLYEHRRRAAEETRDETHHQQQRITSHEHANLAQNHAIGGVDPMDGAPPAGTIVWASSETGIPSVSDRFPATSAAETTRLHLRHGPMPSSSGAYGRASSSGACVHPSGGDGSSLTVMDFPPLGPLSASAGGSTGAGERLGSNKEANGALDDDDDDEAFKESQRNKLGDAILAVLQGLRAELPTAVHCPSVLLENMDMKSLCYREYVAPTTFLAQYVGHECGTDAVSSIEVYLEAGAAVVDFTSLDAAQAAVRLLTGRVLQGRQPVVSLLRTAMPRDEVKRRAIALVASGGGGGGGGIRYDSQPQHRPSSAGRATNVPAEVCGPSTGAHRAPYFASSYDRRQHQQDGMQREGGHSLLERSDSINASGRALAPTAPSFVPRGALPTSGPPDGHGLPTDCTTTWEAERRRRAEQEAADAELALRLQQQLIFEEERRVAEREEHDRRLAELIQGQAAGASSPTTQRQASASGVVLGDRGAGAVRDDTSQQQRPLHRCHDHRRVAETSLDDPSRHDPQQAGTAMPSVELLSQLLPGYMPSLAQGAANAGFREAGRPPHPLPPQQHPSLAPFQQPQTRPSAPPQAFTTSHATRSSTSPSPYHPLAAHHHQPRQTATAASRPVPDQTPDQTQPPSNRFQATYRPPGLGGYRPPGVATVREQSLPDHMGKATSGAAYTPLLQAEPQQQPVQEQRAAEQAPMKTLKRPCVQCGAAEASHLWLPCGHFGHCDACLPDTAPGMDRSEQFGQCLLCDTRAYRYMRTYMT